MLMYCYQDVIDQEEIEWNNMDPFIRDNYYDYKDRRKRLEELKIEYYDMVYADVVPDNFDWSKPHNSWE